MGKNANVASFDIRALLWRLVVPGRERASRKKGLTPFAKGHEGPATVDWRLDRRALCYPK